MKRSIWFVKQCFYNITGNRFRFTLTLLGIIFSSCFFSMGNIYMDSIYHQSFQKYDIYEKYGLYTLEGKIKAEDYQTIVHLFGTNYMEFAPYQSTVLYQTANFQYSVQGNLIGVNQYFSNQMLPTFVDDTLYQAQFLYGRNFTRDEILNQGNRVILDESAALFLYGKSNVVGNVLALNTANDEVSYFEIIGIISSSDYTKQAYQSFSKAVLNAVDQPLSLHLPLYIPLNHPCAKSISGEKTLRIFQEENIPSKNLQLAMRFAEKSHDGFAMNTYYGLRAKLQINLKDTKTLINAVTYVLLIVSAITLLNTMFFSVKERIQEIGIRKTLGATAEAIQLQFIIEAILYSLIGTLIGIMTTIFGLYVVLLLLDIPMIILGKTLSLAIVFPILISMIASMIPAIYASRISIVSALKFE